MRPSQCAQTHIFWCQPNVVFPITREEAPIDNVDAIMNEKVSLEEAGKRIAGRYDVRGRSGHRHPI